MKHNFLRRLGALVLALALTLSVSAVPALAAPDETKPTIQLSQTSLAMYKGDTSQPLTATVLPEGTAGTVLWKSSDETVATVDKGVVKAVGLGSASITAYLDVDEKVSASCVVTVSDPDAVTEVQLRTSNNAQATELTLAAGGAEVLTAVVFVRGGTSTNNDVQDPEVAFVRGQDVIAVEKVPGSAGRFTVTAKAPGIATITVRSKADPSKSAVCRVTVPDPAVVAVTEVKLSETAVTLGPGDTKALTATVMPENASDKSVTWASENNRIASVDQNGTITAVAVGDTKITVTSKADPTKSAVCTVTVAPTVEKLEFDLDGDPDYSTATRTLTLTGGEGDTRMLEVVTVPAGAQVTFGNVDWSESSNGEVITVRKDDRYTSGRWAVLTIVAPGEATVTVRTGKAEPAMCVVVVSGVILESSVLDMLDGKLTMQVGQTEQLLVRSFGAAQKEENLSANWWSSDSYVVDAANGRLVARNPGTATIRFTRGDYSAECTVTVEEDTSGLVDGLSTAAGAPLDLSVTEAALRRISLEKNEEELNYVTNLSVATSQGILYNNHRSEADTGAGIGVTERYYPGRTGPDSLSAVSFVPRGSFSGTAEISYTGYSKNGKSFSGVIRVKVTPMEDVTYTSNGGAPVSFQAEDFNVICNNKTGHNIRYVTFTPPQATVGTLYYNYTGSSQYAEKVTPNTQYSRTSTPSLDRVTFIPAEGFEGTVKISYRGMDTSNVSIYGTVTINVTKRGGASDPADISYKTQPETPVMFQASDFHAASMAVIGEGLSYVRFTLPASSSGTLYYNYRGAGSYDSAVSPTTSYYHNGSPTLSAVTFLPATTAAGRTAIPYTGYGISGTTFTGTVYVSLDQEVLEHGIRYSVDSGQSVAFLTTDFSSACINSTGTSLDYIHFTSLPDVSQGALYYDYRSSNTYNSWVNTFTNYSRANSNALIGNISFHAAKDFTGTVRIPYIGYSIREGETYDGEVVIQVTSPTATDLFFSGTTAGPIKLDAARLQDSCAAALGDPLSYIVITSLPSSEAGYLYTGYNGFDTGTKVTANSRYYVSGMPGIDQLSFLPRGRYQGETSLTYTAVSTTGKQVTSRIVLNIVDATSSAYFTDMGRHAWAAASVDYLYQNRVTNGVTSSTFGPDQKIQRCDFVLMLCRAFGFTGGSGYSFADVPASAYFAPELSAAKRLGIVNGDGVNFRPYDQLTRQDAMVIINNAMKAAGKNMGSASPTILSRFIDGSSVSGYAAQAVSILVNLGAVGGSNGRLNPQQPITRAEAAVILHFVMTM